MRKSVKRVIAGVLSAVLSLSLVNFSALSMSLASELSGYQIGVEYSEDNTSATLVGDTNGLKEGVQLDKLVDSEGQELDPYGLYQTVEENGTYHFTLYYQETVDTQDADQPTTEEKTQELEVVVDGIGKPKADQPQQPEVQEGVQMGTEDEKDAPSPFVQKEESMTAAPKTVPLNVLQRNMAQARESKWVEIRADESNFKLQSVTFTGGPLVAGASGLPSVEGRAFKRADYIVNGTEVSRAINGLYYYNGKWYYTVDTNSIDGGNAGTMYLGYELPENATVRLHYAITNNQKHRLDANGSNADLKADFQMYLNGEQNYTWLMYPQGTKIVLDFVMPVKLSGLNIKITNVGDFNINNAKKLGNNELTENQIWQTSDLKYTLVFTMPAKDVTINFNGTPWTDSETRNFALGSDFTPGNNEVFNDTRYSDFYGEFSGSFFKSIPYNVNNSPGIVNNASLTHVNGGVEASPRNTFQVYNQGSSTQLKTLQFAQGSFKSNQMVGFTLRMDRRDKNGAYAWKANSLVMNVYVGVPYTWSTTNYRQYTIQLAHTNKLGVDSTRNTYLDCGAMVKTVCWQWDENSYFYRIYVYNMTHNFTLYDRPAKTDKTNYVITEMNGFEVAEPGKYNVGDFSVSFAADYNIYDAGAYPIHVNDDWTSDWLGKQALNLRQKQLYLRPKYGYTAPKGSIANAITGTSLLGLGQTLQRNQSGQPFWIEGLYHFQLQSDTNYKQGNGGTPMKLSFNSVPMKLQVGYYAKKDATTPYNNPDVTLSVSGNTFYTIKQTTAPDAGGRKLKGYEVWIKSSFYKENDVSGTLHTEDFQIPCPDSSDNLWHPTQGIISFMDVYDRLQEIGRVTVNETSQLRFVPVYLTDGEAAVQAQYEIVEQTAFAEIDNNNAENRNLTTEGKPQDINATSTKKDLNAYVGSIVNLKGNKEWYQDKATGKYYLYNEKASRPSGTVTAENPVAASLEYLLATKVTVDESTLGNGNNGATWNQSQQNNLYTSVNNFNHQFDLNGIKAGTKSGQVFAGWGIRKSNKEVVAVTDSMKWNSNLNFYNLGKADGALWSDIFNKGTCTLVAMWKSDIEPITNVDGNMQLKTNSPVYVVANDTAGFEISAVFKYGDKTVVNSDTANANQVTLNEIKTKITNKSIKLVVLKKNANAGETNPWTLWFSENVAQANVDDASRPFPIALKETTVDTQSGGFKVTFDVKKTGSSPIAPAYEDGAVYRIFAWSEANGTTDQNLSSLTGDQLKTAMNTNNGGILNLIPCVKTEINVLYKVTTAGGDAIVNQSGTQVEILEGQKSMTISATFRYGKASITAEKLQELVASNNMKIALVKRNPDGSGGWQVRSFDDTQSDGFSGPTVTKLSNGDFQVSFTVKQISNGQEVSLNPTYNDGANFRIFAWTSANPDTTGLTGEIICDALDQATGDANPYADKVPSVNVPVSMLYKVKSSDGNITNKDANVEIKQGATSFTVSGTFQYGKTSVTAEDINTLYNNGNGKLKIALIKKNPGGNTWERRIFGSDGWNGFSGPTITGNGNAFKVEFTVSGSPIDPVYNDGANFRILVWTAANDGGQDLTADAICSALNGANGGNPYDGKVPSVNVQSAVLYKVFSSDGTSITNADKNLEIREGATSFELTGTFQYGNTTVDQAGLRNLFSGGTLKIGLLKMGSTTGENGQRTWEVVQYGDETAITGQPTIAKAGGSNEFTVTFTVNKEITGPSIDGASFRILVWTNANATNDNGNSLTITDIMNTLNSEGENAYNSKIPSATTNTTMLYKVKSSNGNIINEDINVEIYEGGASFKVSGSFLYGDGSATAEEIQDLYNGGAADGKLKIALIKKDPTGGNWQARVFGSDAPAGFSTPTITKEEGSNTFKVEFTVSNANGGAIDPQWNNGANFRIFVWTAANEGGQDLTATTICNELNNAGGTNPYENKIPSVNALATMLYQVKNENGTIGSVEEKTVEGNEGGSLTLEASFLYGDNTADEAKLNTLFTEGKLKIALLKMDPDTKQPNVTLSWNSVYGAGSDRIPKPTIAKKENTNVFTVSFRASDSLNGWYDDGAKFRIYVWTDANGTKEDGTSITGADIMNTLNKASGTDQPNVSGIPWVSYKLNLLYKVVNNGDDTSKTVNVLSTATSIQLSGTFKYNYAWDRYYYDPFTAEMLNALIAAGKFNVTIQVTKNGSTAAEIIEVDPGKLTLSGSSNGIIDFTYAFEDSTGAGLSAYDGAKFEVKVSTAANSNDIPVYTITVVYISDPSAYVNIPKYIILEDDKSNVMENGKKQDGYAGKSAEVTYNTNAGTQVKPEVTVKVQDGVKLHQGSHDGPEMQNMGIGIYNDTGVKISAGTDGYSLIGTLSQSNQSITFWMNTRRGTEKNEQYYATVMFMLEMAGTMT